MDKSLSDVFIGISGGADVECLLTKTYVGKTDDKLDEEVDLGMPLRVAAAFGFRFCGENEEFADDDNIKEHRKKFKVVCITCQVTNEPQ